MFDILQSVVGNYGPLIVEHNGELYKEYCHKISVKNIENLMERIKHIRYLKISQTTDRSFCLSWKASHQNW
jgi:hypothetical protein